MYPAHVQPLQNHFVERGIHASGQEPVELQRRNDSKGSTHQPQFRLPSPYLDQEPEVRVV